MMKRKKRPFGLGPLMAMLSILGAMGSIRVPVARAAAGGTKRVQDPNVENDSTVQQRIAKGLYREGRELLEKGRASEACLKFQTSLTHEPNITTKYWLAECYTKTGRLASAQNLFLEVEAASDDEKHRTFVRDRLEELAPSIPLIKLRVAREMPRSASIRIQLDDRIIPPESWDDAVVFVDNGDHVVIAEAPKMMPWRQRVTVNEHKKLIIIDVPALISRREDLRAKQVRKANSEKSRLGAVAGWGLLGAGFATMVVGTYWSAIGLTGRAGTSPVTPGSNATTAFLGGALGGLTVGLTAFGIYVVTRSQPAPAKKPKSAFQVEVMPVAGPNYGGIGLMGRF